MTYLRINDTTIKYDDTLQYRSIGLVGDGGEGLDVQNIKPDIRLGDGAREREGILFKMSLEDDLRLTEEFLKTGIFDTGKRIKQLNERDKPALERTVRLYREVLSALSGK